MARHILSTSFHGQSNDTRDRAGRRGAIAGRRRRARRPLAEALELRRFLSVGPDAFGYTANTHPYQPIDLAPGEPGVTTLLDNVDDASVAVNLAGNTFNFYGINRTSLSVSSNGLITFGGSNSGFLNADLVSNPSLAAISPLWDDWVANTSGVDQVLARFDSNRLVVEWNMMPHFPGSGSVVSFQAILQLNTSGQPGTIIFNYQDLETGDPGTADGASATVGIKDVGNTTLNNRRLLVSFNSTNPLVGDLQAIRIGTNDPPVAVGDAFAVAEDGALSANVLDNDTDGDGDTLTAALLDGPDHGALAFNSDGSFTYTPDDNYFGPDSFTYRANDGEADSEAAAVSITVNEVNDAPVATDDAAATNEDAPASGNVLGNDADPDNTDGYDGNEDELSVTVLTQPAHGTVSFGPGGNFTYMPDANYFGPDSFQYTLADEADSDVGSVSITVSEVNDTPTANPDGASTTQDQPAGGNVLTNDTDPDNTDGYDGNEDTLSAALVSGATFGSVTLNPDGSFTYTPNTGFFGTDTFSYKANDVDADSNVATVTITVAPAPGGSIYLTADHCNPGMTALVINGTSGDDDIQITPATGGGVVVMFGGIAQGTFTPTGRILVYAGDGNDRVHFASTITHQAWAYGEAGNDTLNLANGGGIAFGGDGADQLNGGSGRDVLVGGDGADRAVANPGDDILVAAMTVYDDRFAAGEHEHAWCAMYKEWRSTRTFPQRVNNLRGTGTGDRDNEAFFFNGATLLDDHDADHLTGSSGSDWFLYKDGEDQIAGQDEGTTLA